MLKKKTILKTAFDTYIIVKQIGEGGNGTVYEATNEDGASVAVKVINKSVSREKLKRFKNEINFGQKYAHDNIIEIKDFGFYENNGSEFIFYVMPLYKYSLRTRIKKGMAEEDIIKAFLNISEGLRFAHNKGCIHRDLKPENILYDESGKYVIADFGIAHFEKFDKLTTVETTETKRLANFAYHAPEQIEGNAYASSDIYALGLILNEMFTQKIPAGDNYKKISEVNLNYSFLDKIIQKMLAQDPNERYQSIQTIYIDYEARKNEFENKQKIKTLNVPLLVGEAKDSLTENPIAIKDVLVQKNKLIISLTNEPNLKWEQIYQKSLSSFTFSPYSYQNFRFYNNQAQYDLETLLGYQNTKELIKGLIKDFKSAVEHTNLLYARNLEADYQYRLQQQIENRQNEIKRLEEETSLNNFIKGLI